MEVDMKKHKLDYHGRFLFPLYPCIWIKLHCLNIVIYVICVKKKIVKLVSHEIHLKTSQFRLTCKSRMTLWQQVHAFYNVECTTNFFSKISSIDNISPGRASYGVVLNKFCLINFPCHDKCSKVQVYPQKIQHVW